MKTATINKAFQKIKEAYLGSTVSLTKSEKESLLAATDLRTGKSSHLGNGGSCYIQYEYCKEGVYFMVLSYYNGAIIVKKGSEF